MSYLAVTHLAFRQTDITPAGMNQRVGKFMQQAIVVRFARQRDGVGFRRRRVTPTVKNHKNKGTIHWIALSNQRSPISNQ